MEVCSHAQKFETGFIKSTLLKSRRKMTFGGSIVVVLLIAAQYV